MSNKVEFVGYIVGHLDVSGILETHIAQLEEGSDDSYFCQAAPIYIKEFDGGKKVRITIGEI